MASEGNAAVELAAGARVPLAGESAANELLKTARPVRVERREDDPARWPEHLRRAGISTSIAAPIVVQGGLWGGVAVVWRRLAPPGADDAERRLPNFAELAGSAIANAESRTELQRRIDEQEALRRVATLVARGVSPSEVQDAVAAEVCRLLDADETKVIRYEADNHITILAASGDNVDDPPVGSRFPLDGDSVSARVWRTSRAARKEDFSSAEGQIAHIARLHGVRSTVGAPIVVDGRLWGLMIASWTRREPPAPDTESRLAQFTDLVAMALANAESRAELTESRARVVATADATRRRIERDLHDGAQQRLVALALDVRAAQAGVPRELGELKAELSGVVERLTDALEELREIAHGIHPGLLAQDGLAPALRTLARQSALPVELDLEADVPLPEAVEVAAYYVVSEALTNASKHANASEVRVDVRAHGGVLEVCVSDDGRGGAELTRGSGLLGLRDRASAIGGQLSLASAPGQGTSLRVTLPLAGG
jgi:signal transduction histidine kinase